MSRGLRNTGKDTSSKQYRLASPARRPTLSCVANQEQLATESRRARLVHQLTFPDKDLDHKDFAACYQNTKSYPTYAATSHTTSFTRRKPKSVIPAYPMQSFRWNPFTNTSSDDCPFDENSAGTCTCENCSGKECSLFETSSRTPDKGKYKNNIMTFADQCTMTPRVADVSCSCNDASCIRDTEVSVQAPDIDSRNTRPSMQPIEFVQRKYPAPILKKNKCKQPCNYYDNSFNFANCYDEECSSCLKYQESERDDDNDRMDRNSVKSRSKFWNNGKYIDNRKMDTEGTPDMVVNECPVNTRSVPSTMRSHCSRPALKVDRALRCFMDEENPIPFSHRSDSRYHQSCKGERKVFYYEDDFGYLIGGPGHMNRRRFTPRSLTPPSKLPKRVLTSDRDIEAFIDNSYSTVPAAARKNI